MPIKKKPITRKSPGKKLTAAPRKKVVPKKKAVAAAAKKKMTGTPRKKKMTAEDKFKLIELEAFILAEKDHFKKDPLFYWVAAEQMIHSLYE